MRPSKCLLTLLYRFGCTDHTVTATWAITPRKSFDKFAPVRCGDKVFSALGRNSPDAVAPIRAASVCHPDRIDRCQYYLRTIDPIRVSCPPGFRLKTGGPGHPPQTVRSWPLAVLQPFRTGTHRCLKAVDRLVAKFPECRYYYAIFQRPSATITARQFRLYLDAGPCG